MRTGAAIACRNPSVPRPGAARPRRGGPATIPAGPPGGPAHAAERRAVERPAAASVHRGAPAVRGGDLAEGRGFLIEVDQADRTHAEKPRCFPGDGAEQLLWPGPLRGKRGDTPQRRLLTQQVAVAGLA